MDIDTNGFELEDTARDRITGYTGLITGFTQWITGCARAQLQAPLDKDGKVPETFGADVLTLVMVKKGPRHKATTKPALIGGPMPSPARGRDVQR